jgi:hypothetical protein
MMKKYVICASPVLIVLFSLSANDCIAETTLEQFLKATTKKENPLNCSLLVEKIREDTRLRIATRGTSIEQISGRSAILSEPTRLECQGEALMSDSQRLKINYGATKDNYGDWIIKYSVENQ